MPRKTSDEETNPGRKASTEELRFATGLLASYCRVGTASFGLLESRGLASLELACFCLRKLSGFLWSVSVLEALSPESQGSGKFRILAELLHQLELLMVPACTGHGGVVGGKGPTSSSVILF